MAAYYNEFDPFAAAWLRELIKAGHIAPGEVDERSILEVRPDDLRGFTQCHFFAGIGVWSYALRCAGWPDSRPVWTGSCPCQPFSAAGKQEGHADERHLAPVWLRLIEECRPAIVIGEQVSAAVGMGWLDALFIQLEQADYACGAAVFPACSVGAPHIRSRLYFVANADKIGRYAAVPATGTAFGSDWDSYTTDSATIGATGELADAAMLGREQFALQRPAEGECGIHGAQGSRIEFGTHGFMGDPSRGGLGERGDAPLAGSSGHPVGAEQPCVMVYAEQPRLEGLAGHGDDGDRPGRNGAIEAGSTAAPSESRATGTVEHPDRPIAGDGELQRRGATNGFWANAEWLPCRDGKARPVEPGTSPLAHGASNRVGRLRGYGNAICAPQAQEFVRAYMEATQ